MSTPESAAAAGIPWKAVGTGTALALVAFLMFIALPEADNEQVVVAPTDQTEVKQQLRS
ncbi:MAG: hypothetical protein KDA69_19680 [Planctomycetaceae bacterium]|nr:hypothetical protein [Planctomycetaceae bacterium]